MQKLGQEISAEEIHEMINKHDIVGDGVLSYDEFKRIFFDKDEPIDDYDKYADMDQPFGKSGPQVDVV